MESTPVEVSIVIVTWNAARYMVDCLKSLERQTALPTEIIVVDNASSDGTARLIRDRFPDVILVESDRNLGFAKANNVGIARSKGRFLFLVNPDVIVMPGCLNTLVNHMKSDPSVGLVGPGMLGPEDRIVRRSTMRFPTPWNALCRALALDSIFKRSRTFGGFMMNDFAHDRNADVEILNGWFWGVRRDAVEQVGVLDDQLFMYGDDLDWSYRFHRAGYRNLFCADAAAIHYGGGTTAKAPAYFYIERQRANIQFWQKYHDRSAVAFYVFTIWLHELVCILGYCGVFLCRKSARGKAAYKIGMSKACLLWLLGLRSNEKALA